MDYRTQLLTLAATYADARGISQARIGTLAANHGGFFERVRGGGAVSVDVYLRVKNWFADHWPADVAWPDGVDRPDVLPVTASVPSQEAAA